MIMNRTISSVSMLACAAALGTTAAHAQELVVDSDNRSGGTSAFAKGIGSVDPVESTYNTDPGETEYVRFDIDFSNFDGDTELGVEIDASLDTVSEYVGWIEDEFTFDGLFMESTGSVSILQAINVESRARSNDFVSMGFRVEDLGPDGSFRFRIRGFANNAEIELSRGGSTIFFRDGGSFDQEVLITQTGEYRLRGVGDVELERSMTGFWTDSFSFEAEMTIIGPCQGDLNDDGRVDGADLSAVLSAWGPCSGGCDADLSGDGQVNGADIAIILSAWGDC